MNENALLCVSISEDNLDKHAIQADIRKRFPSSIVVLTPNTGKDIGGKLVLIDMLIRCGIEGEYFFVLHDKLSHQVMHGDAWRLDLLKIARRDMLSGVFRLFDEQSKIGMIGSAGCISNEYDKQTAEFRTTNSPLLREYIRELGLKLDAYDFVGGTIFWVRGHLFDAFFKKHSPLTYRARLEPGNVLDEVQATHTHSWERLFGWIVNNSGYTVAGI